MNKEEGLIATPHSWRTESVSWIEFVNSKYFSHEKKLSLLIVFRSFFRKEIAT